MIKEYSVKRINIRVSRALPVSDSLWQLADRAGIDYFYPDGSPHKPRTSFRMLYNNAGIFILFRVNDRYVRSLHTQYNAKVHEDSCIECFLQVPGALGYYNFEINAGATLHVNYIIDPERGPNGKRKDLRTIPESHAKRIDIISTLPPIVHPEIKEPVEWSVSVYIPFDFFSLYSPVTDSPAGTWRGNFYKCADKCSHPHWASWNPIRALNFHNTGDFGKIIFKKN